MWKDAVLIMLSCTMFVQTGLSDAIQEGLHVRFRILSCQKCCSFWACLAYLILSGSRIVEAVAVSFLLSYFALWLALLLDALAVIYNKFYEYITQASRPSEVSGPGDNPNESATAGADEVSEV